MRTDRVAPKEQDGGPTLNDGGKITFLNLPSKLPSGPKTGQVL